VRIGREAATVGDHARVAEYAVVSVRPRPGNRPNA